MVSKCLEQFRNHRYVPNPHMSCEGMILFRSYCACIRVGLVGRLNVHVNAKQIIYVLYTKGFKLCTTHRIIVTTIKPFGEGIVHN